MKITNLIDIRQTPQYSAFMKSLGWKTVFYKKSQIYIKKLPLLPLYVGKMLHSHSLCCQKEIIEVRRKYSLIQFSYEPFFIEKEKYGRVFWQINSDSKGLIPTKTLWLNLDNNNLLNNLKAKTRYNLKRASKRLDFELIKGCEVKKDQLDKILALWSVNKPYTKLFPAPKQEFINLLKTFDKKCFIVRSFEKHNLSKTLAFCLILHSSNMAFYWHNASSVLGRQLFAPTLCVWQAILECKKRKLKVFDFEGLYDERFPQKNLNWKGFSRFKEGFYKI